MLLPNRLHKGDKIGVIAPASPPNIDQMYQAFPFIESLGLEVVLGNHVKDVYGYLAGKDEDRLSDFHAMFRNPDIKGIFCAGGGYGTGRIAGKIDYKLVKENPKPFWGYSDITYLHTAIRQQTGLVTFHGPMLSSDIGKDDFHEKSQDMFRQLFAPAELNYSTSYSELMIISEGAVSGELVGGNLSLLVSTLGTPYELEAKGKLLLIEDIDEEPYRVDGMLNQLKLSGKLDEAAGILIGDFKNAEPSKRKESLSLSQVLSDYLSDLNKPIIAGFKIGHCQPHFAVPLGVHAEMSTKKLSLTIAPGVK
ncbi:muramoyltetrapeptide carboxypeptidase [Thalassobacillus cyri]|uniref:Muramoyltetrapeptide carboxypeptidase n=1 Tax=Thalassobacillus cyri TaxID=571932 RepID=A0A1H4HDC0_9BACI|nr:LD-carboxypeptidase [Thalassobacillus cyri]SEB19601.1 muramoyltetrapeptide carboxypeptidase [Thalassobacillus cyri]